ncbi:MAG: aspartate/glutamate racemase family protein [Acetobacteraceae bacterium]|nr:aspartate/glutamate racemase family protein [Acetobacteraceae bacterium]
MKICYLFPADMRRSAAGEAELERRGSVLQSWAGSGVLVGCLDLPGGPPFRGAYHEEYLAVAGTLERVREAAAQGYDAVVLGSLAGSVLEAEEPPAIPVVGPGEAAMLVAAMMGRGFSLLTLAEEAVPHLRHLAAAAGVAQKLWSVRAAGLGPAELARNPQEGERRLEAVAREVLSEPVSPDVLVLGCLSLGFLGVAESLSRALGVPVLNPARISLKMAELLAG